MRAVCTGDLAETMYTELPSCGRLLTLCNDIATARHHGDLVLEEVRPHLHASYACNACVSSPEHFLYWAVRRVCDVSMVCVSAETRIFAHFSIASCDHRPCVPSGWPAADQRSDSKMFDIHPDLLRGKLCFA